MVTVKAKAVRPQTPTDPNALIVNGDFEADAAIGWKNSPYIMAGVGKDGSWGIAWQHTHDGNGNWIVGTMYDGTNLTAKLKPNTKYILEFDYKSEGAGFLQLYNWDTFSIDFTQGKSIALTDSADWTKYTYAFTTTATIPTTWNMPFYFRYVMYGNASGTGTGSAAVDNVKLTEVPVATGIKLDKETASVKVGKTFTLSVSTEPELATKPEITWTSSNEAVATVDANGVVTGVAAGTATITATAGSLVDTCEVTIVEDDGNLFENGDFEQGAAIAWGDASWIQAGVGKDGSYGAKIQSTVDENTTTHQQPGFYYKDELVSKLQPDTVYQLTFDYKHEGKGFGMIYLNKDFGTVEGSGKDFYQGQSLTSGEVEWKTVTYTFYTPSAALSASKGVEFLLRQVQYATAGNEGTGVTYFDNFKLVKVRDVLHADEIKLAPSELELLPDSTGTVKVMTTPDGAATGILTFTSSDTTVATVDKNGKVTSTGKEGEATITVTNDRGKSSTAKVTVTKHANLLKNGDFEQGGDNWGNHVNIENGIGKDGGYGLKMTGTNKAIYYKTSISGMTPATTYIFTFDYYRTDGSDFRVWTADYFGLTSSVSKGAVNEWQTRTVIFTTPANFKLNSGWDLCFVSDKEGTRAPAVIDNVTLRRYDSGVMPNSVNLDKTEVTLIPGRTAALTLTADPKEANLNDTTWVSSDDNVATVEYGVVTAVGKGTATVTATTTNGKTVSCTVTVSGDEAYIKNGTFDIANDTNWQLKDGAELAAGEGRLGTTGAMLPKGASLVYNVTGLKPDTEYQLSLKSRTASGALKVTLADGETVLLSDKTGTSSSWATSNFEFKTPANCSGNAVLTLAPAGNGPVYVDNVRLNVKASLVDFVVSDMFWTGGGYQVTPGTELEFGFTVTNQGEDPVKAGQTLVVEVRKNGKAFMTVTEEIKEDLASGGSVIFVADEKWKAEEGHWVISVRANPTLSILEMVDTNNTMQKNLRVDNEILEAPEVAADLDLSELTFSDEFDSLDSIDQYASGDDGYKWYVTRQWAATTITPDCYSIDDGVISLASTQPGYHVTLSTMDVNTQIGYTWNKGYLEVRLRIPIADPDEEGLEYDGSPAIWSFPDTKWLELKGRNHKWVEMDWLEYWGVTAARPGGYYTITYHDQHNKTEDQEKYWYSNSNAYQEGLGDEQWHTMGWLWVDNAVVTYVDGVQVQKITYSEDGMPSCRLQLHDSVDMDATGAYSLMNDLYNVLFVSGGKNFPLELDYVHIWQSATGGEVLLPDTGDGEAPAVDVDANDFWYYYCTDDYGDNIVEINEENYYIVLEGKELWEQLSDERKAEINALLAANGQPSFDELLAAALAFESGEETTPPTGATTVLPLALAAVMVTSGTVLVKARKRKEDE